MEAAGKEGAKFEGGDGLELGFLEKDDIRKSRQKFGKHITTFNRVIEALNIPTTKTNASIH
jgi:hypothetical protein